MWMKETALFWDFPSNQEMKPGLSPYLLVWPLLTSHNCPSLLAAFWLSHAVQNNQSLLFGGRESLLQSNSWRKPLPSSHLQSSREPRCLSTCIWVFDFFFNSCSDSISYQNVQCLCFTILIKSSIFIRNIWLHEKRFFYLNSHVWQKSTCLYQNVITWDDRPSASILL